MYIVIELFIYKINKFKTIILNSTFLCLLEHVLAELHHLLFSVHQYLELTKLQYITVIICIIV